MLFIALLLTFWAQTLAQSVHPTKEGTNFLQKIPQNLTFLGNFTNENRQDLNPSEDLFRKLVTFQQLELNFKIRDVSLEQQMVNLLRSEEIPPLKKQKESLEDQITSLSIQHDNTTTTMQEEEESLKKIIEHLKNEVNKFQSLRETVIKALLLDFGNYNAARTIIEICLFGCCVILMMKYNRAESRRKETERGSRLIVF